MRHLRLSFTILFSIGLASQTLAQNVGIGTSSPATKLDVLAPGNWNTATSEGDVRIGNASYRLKIGVALGGGGAGDIRITAAGGTNRLYLGGGTNTNVAVVDGTNQRLGINTYDPNTVLDVFGDLALKTTTATLTGVTPNFAVNTTATPRSYYRISSPVANFNITSLTFATAVGTSSSDGRIITLQNATGFTMTINNQDATATAAQRIITGTSANLNIGAGGSATFVYNTTDNRWVLRDYNGGATGGNDWKLDGNNNGVLRTLGTNDAFDLPLETSGTEKARLTTAGNLGINTTIPTSKLHVHNVSDVSKSTTFSYASQTATGEGADYDNIGLYGLGKGANGTWGYGVGAAAIGDAANSWGAVGLYAGLGMAAPNFSFVGSSNYALYSDALSLGYSGIFMNGNVGIGTTSPNRAILEQNGMVGNTSAIFGGNTTGISLVSSYPGVYFNAYYNGGMRAMSTGFTGNISLDPTNGRYTFATGTNVATDGLAAGTERMTILNNGNVGIGTSAPSVLLDVRGGVIINENAGINDVRMESSSRPYMFWLDAASNVVSFGSSAGFLTSNGATVAGVTVDYIVDIDRGTATGTATGIGSIEFLLDGVNETTINNDYSPTSHISYDLGYSTTTRAWRDVYASSFITTSDAREKSNIQNLNYGLAEVMNMRPVSYKLNKDPFAEPRMGLIAQELLPLVPQSVKTHSYKVTDETKPNEFQRVEFDRMGIDYTTLVPVLINAVKEQQGLIQELQDKVAKLEGKAPVTHNFTPHNQEKDIEAIKAGLSVVLIGSSIQANTTPQTRTFHSTPNPEILAAPMPQGKYEAPLPTKTRTLDVQKGGKGVPTQNAIEGAMAPKKN